MDLLNYIGETSSYDKKVMLEEKRPKSWLKSVSAFANTRGGKIFFGIDDSDKLIGLKNAKKDSETISELIKTKLDPIPHIDLQIIRNDEKDFIVLSIFEGNETPYYLIDGGSRTAYTRIGNESVIVSSIQIKNLVLKGINKTFDNLPSSIPKERASFSKLKAVYYKETGNDLMDSDFLSFGLVDNNGYLTNAGALLADDRLIYQSKIFATRWNGRNKTNGKLEALDDEEFEGSLLYLLQSGEDFIRKKF
ncbi:AlbA family DNA-binding domain-containing protein [Gemelliphila palaticanis]|uniref:AlbA family DNA-binding domain-containing protein n=1 Tax=Gemelliphila palaticanis TaxID=81950 RepID=UPI001C54F362|nr:RNA-binding domain-containing protein [Gemella palaticanis]